MDNCGNNILGQSISTLIYGSGKKIYRSFNKIVEINDQRRTSYYLTDDGYNLLLSTLEIDNNMRLTIHEMIFINYLCNNVVGISNIEIKLYKIEETRQSEISWNNVSTNSGGEGFLSAFVFKTYS